MAADPVPWTFATGGEPVEQMEWLTEVFRAPTGPEQRRRLRSAPRTVLQFDGLESGRRRRWLETLLHANGAGKWWVPLTTDAIELAAPLPAGSVQIPQAVGDVRFTTGGKALISHGEPREFEIVEVGAVLSNAVMLAGATVRDWAAGAKVAPVRLGRLESVPQLSRFTSDAVPYQARFRMDEPMNWPASFGAAAYRALPVLEWVPTWTADPEYSPLRDLTTEDAETGPVAVFDQSGTPVTLQKLQYVLRGEAEISAFRGLLSALAGRWSAIWVPTWAHDLRIVAGVAGGSNTVDVEWSGLSAWPLAINRRDIRIQLADRSVVYRRITAATQISDGVERIALDAALPVAIPATSVVMVSFMALSRQDTDVNKLVWWSRHVVKTELSFRGFKHEL